MGYPHIRHIMHICHITYKMAGFMRIMSNIVISIVKPNPYESQLFTGLYQAKRTKRNWWATSTLKSKVLVNNLPEILFLYLNLTSPW